MAWLRLSLAEAETENPLSFRRTIPKRFVEYESLWLYFKGPFTLPLEIAIPKSDSLAIAMLAKEMAYPTHSLVKSLAKICLFPVFF